MTNLEVAWILADIARLLEIKQENVFKIRAYFKASKVIQRLPEDLANEFCLLPVFQYYIVSSIPINPLLPASSTSRNAF